MWQAKIADKKLSQGTLNVLIAYLNGTDDFTEWVGISTAETLDVLIANRLKALEGLSALSQSLAQGTYSPTVQPTVQPVVVTTVSAVNKFSRIKYLADLGLIDVNDSRYTQAFSDAKAEVGK